MSEKQAGTVVWFNGRLGYGFIKPQSGDKDIFLHWSDISAEGYKTLKKGQLVSYNVGLNLRGEPKAIDIVVIE